jgi:hypothetical protein
MAGILGLVSGALGLAKGAAGLAGAGSGTDVRGSLASFTASVPEIKFEDIVREPKPSYNKVKRTSPEAVANRVLKYTLDTAIPGLSKAAERITESNVEITKSAINEMFPGYDAGVANLSRNIQDRQEGRLTIGSRRLISRSLAGSGALRSLGPEAMDQAYTGFLGMASEDMATKGDTMMMQAVPTFRNIFRVTGVEDLMGYGGLTTGQAIQTDLQENERMQQGFQFDVSTRLQKDLNMAQLTMSDRNFRYNYGLQAAGLAMQGAAQRAGQVGGAMDEISSGLGAIFGGAGVARNNAAIQEAGGGNLGGAARAFLGMSSRI